MARIEIKRPDVEDPVERLKQGLPPLPRVDLTDPEIRKALGMKVEAGVHKETVAAADDSRPASRVNGWDEDLDHTKRHALVDAQGIVKWMIAPHVKGSINSPSGIFVDTAAGQRIVRVMGKYTDRMRELYRAGALVVDDSGKMKKADGAVVDRYQRARAAQIDETTAATIRQGAEWKGQVVSLSPNAIAKYSAARAMSHALSYPYTFSAADNVGEVVITDAAEMEQFTSTVLASYLELLARGDALKKKIRQAKSPTKVDEVVDDDSRM